MADYWKSNAKKYCDFCKCWIADNKPSIDFHEKGKRHKENVTIRLKSISKQSAKDHKEKKKFEEDLKKMEKAALEAYLKDVEKNADYTSQMLNKQLCADKSKEDGSTSANVEIEETVLKLATEKQDKGMKCETSTSYEWYEAVSDEGYTYYWNTVTGESVWEPPEGGYTSLEKQKKLKEAEEQSAVKRKLEEARQKEENEKMKAEEYRAFIEREKMKERAKVEKVDNASKVAIGPAPRGNPYGSWTTVKKIITKPVDLQLPNTKRAEFIQPTFTVNEPAIKFKEKHFDSLEVKESSGTNFKKRKFNMGSKRNMRQRLDVD